MPPLQAAFAFPQMGDVALGVAQQLYLDVAGVGDQFLDIKIPDAKGSLGLGCGMAEGISQIFGGFDAAHPASAATGQRLQHHGAILQVLHERQRLLGRDGRFRAFGQWGSGFAGNLSGCALVAK